MSGAQAATALAAPLADGRWLAMAGLALCFLGVFLVLGLGVRGWLFHRRTGYGVVRGLQVRRRFGSVEWLSGKFTGTGFAGLAVGAILDLTGVLGRVPALSGRGWQVAGAAVSLAGFAGTQWAASAMGESWRLTPDESERPRLVTGGPFRHVRNPLFTAMMLLVAGVAAMAPNVVCLVSVPLVAAGLEMQVRMWEEPYLRGACGADWVAYASRAGRFVPGLGRIREVPGGA